LKYAKEEALKQGITEGIKQGIKEGKLETARKLKSLGVEINIIVQSTGLTEEEIQKL
jgi:predicted transposase/invertase (TIGR01784 family)